MTIKSSTLSGAIHDHTSNVMYGHDLSHITRFLTRYPHIFGKNNQYIKLIPHIYQANIWQVFERLISHIRKMDRKYFKGVVADLLEFTIGVLTGAHVKLKPKKVQEAKNWNVWILNTKTHLAIVAARDDVTEMIPSDGTFLSGVLLFQGLTEKAARVKVSELESAFGPNESTDTDQDLS